MSERIGVVVVGAGYWGPNLIRNVAASPRARLVGVCDKDPKALARAQGRHPGVAGFESLEAALAAPGVDAVVLATPSSLHPAHTLACLRAGKHVLVEKPLATTVEQALEVARAADELGRTLAVGHVFLHNSIVREAKRRIDAGDLGRVLHVHSQRLNLGQFRNDTDVLWTLAPHDVSILGYWLGARPERVRANGLVHGWAGKGVIDTCFALLEYPEGKSAHLHLSWIDPQKVRRMVVVGDQRMLIYDDVDAEHALLVFDKGVDRPPLVSDFADFKTRIRTGDVVIPAVRLEGEPLSLEIDHFLECVQTGKRPVTDGWHGVEVTAILAAIERSMREEGRPVEVVYP